MRSVNVLGTGMVKFGRHAAFHAGGALRSRCSGWRQDSRGIEIKRLKELIRGPLPRGELAACGREMARATPSERERPVKGAL
jgi:hypothetical protein